MISKAGQNLRLRNVRLTNLDLSISLATTAVSKRTRHCYSQHTLTVPLQSGFSKRSDFRLEGATATTVALPFFHL